MTIVWLPLSREWAVVIDEAEEVARFATLLQAEEWWLAEGFDLYGDAS